MNEITIIASTRPVFDPAAPKMTLSIPPEPGADVARKGDVLLAILVHDPADGFTVPAGWSLLGTDGASVAAASYIVRMVDDREPSSVVVSLLAASAEWQGVLLVLRGAGAMALLKEASNSATFAADATPAAATASSLQAINLAIATWSSSGALTWTAPASYEAIDSYSTALVGARSVLFAYAVANATGTINPGDATASGAATGRAFLAILRGGLPLQPETLADLVPGNIGLIGKDTRPPREVAFGA